MHLSLVGSFTRDTSTLATTKYAVERPRGRRGLPCRCEMAPGCRGVRRYFRTSAGDARLTASQSLPANGDCRWEKTSSQKASRLRRSLPSLSFLPVNPRTTSYPKETLQKVARASDSPRTTSNSYMCSVLVFPIQKNSTKKI